MSKILALRESECNDWDPAVSHLTERLLTKEGIFRISPEFKTTLLEIAQEKGCSIPDALALISPSPKSVKEAHRMILKQGVKDEWASTAARILSYLFLRKKNNT